MHSNSISNYLKLYLLFGFYFLFENNLLFFKIHIFLFSIKITNESLHKLQKLVTLKNKTKIISKMIILYLIKKKKLLQDIHKSMLILLKRVC